MAGNYGFIHEKIDIKVLILFIMRRLFEPITFEALTELTLFDGGISYFDYSECVADLVRTGHLRFEGDAYSITDKGMHNGGVVENNLPYSVRIKAENRASMFRALQGREAMIETSSAENPDGGFVVNLALSDGVGEIVKMELYTVNESQARSLEKGFRKNAEGIYHAIMEMLLGNKNPD